MLFTFVIHICMHTHTQACTHILNVTFIVAHMPMIFMYPTREPCMQSEHHVHTHTHTHVRRCRRQQGCMLTSGHS